MEKAILPAPGSLSHVLNPPNTPRWPCRCRRYWVQHHGNDARTEEWLEESSESESSSDEDEEPAPKPKKKGGKKVRHLQTCRARAPCFPSSGGMLWPHTPAGATRLWLCALVQGTPRDASHWWCCVYSVCPQCNSLTGPQPAKGAAEHGKPSQPLARAGSARPHLSLLPRAHARVQGGDTGATRNAALFFPLLRI